MAPDKQTILLLLLLLPHADILNPRGSIGSGGGVCDGDTPAAFARSAAADREGGEEKEEEICLYLVLHAVRSRVAYVRTTA